MRNAILVVDTSYSSPDPELMGELDVGASMDGGIAFEVQVAVHAAAMTWAPSPLFSDVKWPTYTWKLVF